MAWELLYVREKGNKKMAKEEGLAKKRTGITPGPWFFKEKTGAVVNDQGEEIVNSNGGWAGIFNEKDGWLIAAAPELLEVVKGLCKNFTTFNFADFAENVRELSLVIKKAETGRTDE